VLTLKPDRISFYSYAHVPWLRPGQRGYEDADLPSDVQKRSLYEIGREKLKAADYHELGMDHFALQHDSLYKAHRRGALHRNFMGYTTTNTDLLIGLGASAISDAKYAYAQNAKKVDDYLTAIKETSAVVKGHLLTEEDLLLKASILEISCTGSLSPSLMQKVQDTSILIALEEMETEGILQMSGEGGFRITPAGEPFIRNVCRVFDKRMGKQGSSDKLLFSKAI
jgi:oxygen-independent coproporphyrinogen-3 oxidase